MRISLLTLNGDLFIMYRKIVPVALLIISNLFACAGRAQVYSCNFRYEEHAITDYTSLLSRGNVKQKRETALFHAGTMNVMGINDSMLHIQMQTDSFSTTMPGVNMPAVLKFNAYTGSDRRVYKVSTTGNNKLFLSVLQLWLGEMHFQSPPAGIMTEVKPDGDLRVTYHLLIKGKDAGELIKDNAAYLVKPNSKQALVLDQYQWKSSFNRLGPNVVRFSEKKRQLMGRKVLACIQRELVVDAIASKEKSSALDTNGYQPVYLYPRFTEKERRERLAASLLGQEDISTISSKLKQAASLTNEQQFRLKSILRSLFILDSTAITSFLDMPEMKQQGSVAFEIIENAIIESGIPAANDYISRALQENEKNYERSKELLIKVSLAEALTRPTVQQLLDLLQKNIDPDTRSMVSLALSNYALSIRDDTVFYNRITARILEPFRNNINDTLQYTYLTGNAGMASETERLIRMANNSRYRTEAYFALRNISNPAADAAIRSYLLAYRGNENVFESLLAKREMPASFWSGLEKNIITADARKDSTALPAIRYVLDNAWQRDINVKALLSHRFQTEAYRQEVEDFIRQSSLCN
jgi:hypothetical protein